MKMLFIGYPPCTTCKKAYNHYLQQGYEIEYQNIKEKPPTKQELITYFKKSGLPLNKLFNTSGLIYREMNLKERLKQMNDEEKLTLLAKHGMLIKRPIIVTDDEVIFGFKIK